MRQSKGEALLRYAEGGGHFAICAEGGIERAIAVVAHQLEIVSSVEIGVAPHNNLSVRLYGNGHRACADPKIGDHFASCPEVGIERAIAVVACQHEVVEKAN